VSLSTTQDVGIVVTAADSIANGATDTVSAASSDTIVFAGSTGTLALTQPATFTGEIAGISGSRDVLDLHGFAGATTTASTGSGSFNSATDTTTLTVTDPGHTTLEFTLTGNLSTSTWTVTADSSHTGVDIVDPPATNSPSGSTGIPSVITDGVNDTFTFADSDTSATQKASFEPEGSNYVGSFSVSSVSVNNGSGSVEYNFTLGDQQVKLAPDQTVTQSYELNVTDPQNSATITKETISVSIGGPGNDNFIFKPGIGADTIVNFNPQVDTIEFDEFANAKTLQQLASLIAHDAHGDAVIDLGHNDSITVPGLTHTYLQTHLEALVRLH
jgi:hypothetical protein